MKRKELAKTIDHTLLKPTATAEQIDKLCAEAVQNGFMSVCVNPCWVKRCSEKLDGHPPVVCTVIGFPLGASSTRTKRSETKAAVEDGAREIDMVMNIGKMLDGDYDYVENDIRVVVKAAGNALVKVIIETCYLDNDRIVKACRIAKDAGADFVKTSTGFGTGGATVEDVALMKKTVGDDMWVKASGGIRTYDDAMNMLKAGASRIGASAGISIVSEAGE